MSENLTFQVKDVDEERDRTIIELEGTASSLMPDFVVNNRARLKAIRVVGGEHVVRGAINEIAEGDLGRVTDILEFESNPLDMPGMREIFVVVGVQKTD